MARGVGGKSPANVAKYLAGIDFPCQKEDLITHAEHNGAEDEVLEMLRHMPEDEYGNMADVMKGYGKVYDQEDEGPSGNGQQGGGGSQGRATARSRTKGNGHAEQTEDT